VASTGVVITLLLGLAKDEGAFSSSAPVVGRVALVATVALGGFAVFCAVGCLWPRKYERLGAKGLVNLNKTEFLDKPEHKVMGHVVASRIGIVRKMDEHHEAKAKWLKWSFRFLVLAFVGLIVQGAVLAIDPPARSSKASATVGGGSKAAQSEPAASREPKTTKHTRASR
jgi:hypothetical protein